MFNHHTSPPPPPTTKTFCCPHLHLLDVGFSNGKYKPHTSDVWFYEDHLIPRSNSMGLIMGNNRPPPITTYTHGVGGSTTWTLAYLN